MGVAGHKHVNLLFGPLQGHMNKGEEVAPQCGELVPKPQPHVCGNLVVAAAMNRGDDMEMESSGERIGRGALVV